MKHKVQRYFVFTCMMFVSTWIQSEVCSFYYGLNHYKDVRVIIPDCGDVPSFEKRLIEATAFWKNEGRKAIWLTLPTTFSSYLPTLLKHTFIIHHADKEKIVLNKWLSEDAINALPSSPNHKVSVAALVVDADNQVLCVKEKYGNEHLYDFRLPGGGVGVYEDIAAAAIREVQEQVNLETEFEAIVAFRDSANDWSLAMELVSKIYFCVLLRPLKHKITTQKNKITDARWMPLEEFKAQAKGIFLDFINLYQAGGPFMRAQLKNGKRTVYS